MFVSQGLRLALSVGILASSGILLAQQGGGPARDATGSWFGRAVPENPFCTPGTAGCPVPKEIVMLPTFFADGNFIGIDSNVFVGFHSTAHGQWVRRPNDSVYSEFMWLQSRDKLESFFGAFRVRLNAQISPQNRDLMVGAIEAFAYPFANENNEVILGADGFPNPDPLAAPLPQGCAPPACLGRFPFTLRRISAEAPPQRPVPVVSFTADPNPVVTSGSTGVVTLNWFTPGTVRAVEVRVGSPTGTLLVRSGSGRGSAVTGNWVTNGMTFYLQDVTEGKPLTAENTLATVTVQLRAQ